MFKISKQTTYKNLCEEKKTSKKQNFPLPGAKTFPTNDDFGVEKF